MNKTTIIGILIAFTIGLAVAFMSPSQAVAGNHKSNPSQCAKIKDKAEKRECVRTAVQGMKDRAKSKKDRDDDDDKKGKKDKKKKKGKKDHDDDDDDDKKKKNKKDRKGNKGRNK